MTTDSRSRKWQLTVNNPLEHGITHDYIIENVEKLSFLYYCFADEVGVEGTPHTHIYIYCSSAISFSRLKKLFPPAHFELAKGTSLENKQYILKIGKWADTAKAETSVDGSFFESGECPAERQGQRNDISDLYAMVKEGLSNFEILEQCPQFLFNVDKIEKVRQVIKSEEYKNCRRILEVTYIYGDTGTGKTRSVMDKYGYCNVYQIQNYEHPFDGYKGQDVIIFEEFRSSLKIQDMLIYLDCYPLMLPCRYADKVACFTKVYIISNISLQEQYNFVQRDNIETYRAFCRRIGRVQYFSNSKIQTLQDKYFEVVDDRGFISLED